MPKQRIDSLEFWYGTPDAPAPQGNLTLPDEPVLVVGASNETAANAVAVRYRRMGEAWHELQPERFRPAPAGHLVQFRFPSLERSVRIEYEIRASIPGRSPEQIGPRQTFRVNPGHPPRLSPLHLVAAARAAVAAKRDAKPDVASAGVGASTIDRPEVVTAEAPPLREPAAERAPEKADPRSVMVSTLALHATGGDEDMARRVLSILENRGITKLQDLAGVSREEITSVLEKTSEVGRNAAKDRAANLRAVITNAFPTDTLSPTRTPLPPPPSHSATPPVGAKPEVIAKAWNDNAGLDLLRLDISKDSVDRTKLDLTGLERAERRGFIRDIQVRQSAMRATGSAVLAESLLKKGVTSAAAISPIRLAQESGVSLARAKNIHERDIQHYGRLSHGLFTLIDAYSGGLQDIAVGNLRRAKVVDFIRPSDTAPTFDGLDNIQQLFGDLDSCNCSHCNSILGPAAYFVDLMHFVQTHVLDEDVVEGDAPFKGKQQHRLHLRTRRPDLWVLPLTCETTQTEVSQLQITSEIFENFIATKRGIDVTSDRAAVVAAVYGTILPGGRHSVLQPFHLPIEELHVYLGHFQISRGEIVRMLDEPEQAQLGAELGMTKVQADLIATEDASAINIFSKLGLTVPADGILTVRQLLDATQLPRQDLGELLQSVYVGGSQPLAIVPEKKSAESVQFDIERVHGISIAHLDRVHRLLKLRRHLAWLPKELDGFIASAGGALDSGLLADAGRAVLLKERFRASALELCALAGDLPEFCITRKTAPGDEERTPFDLLFNVPDLIRQDGRYPDRTVRFSTVETSSAQRERAMRLRAALRVDEGALIALVEGLSGGFEDGPSPQAASVLARFFAIRLRALPPPDLPPSALPAPARPLPPVGTVGSFPLSKHNLSLLVRHAVFGRWLKLSITDLFTLIRLTPDVGHYLTNLADALAVLRFYDWWKSTPLSLEDLSLLLAPTEALRTQVEDLWTALQAWLREEDQASFTDTFLTQVDGVSEDLSRQLVAINTGKVFTADGGRFRMAASGRPEDLDLTPTRDTKVDLEAIRALVRQYHPSERLPRALTQLLKTEIDLARAVVATALADASKPAAEDFLRQQAEMPAGLGPALVAILRLHRLGSALRLSPATLTFLAENQNHFGMSTWAEPNPGAVRRMSATQSLLKQRFRENPAPAFAHIARLLADHAKLAEVAVDLLGLDPSLARDLATNLPIPENAIDALFKMEAYAQTTNRLSVDAVALSNIASEDYPRATAASAAVMAGFRAKYPDEAAWKEKVEPYQERVLEKKRDALIDHLLHGPEAEFPDTREIYKYFLIDGEVDGCFRTSRVVAASSSLQLYVHRIRMNLEKEPKDGLHVQPSLIPVEEWEWRQHYRVWEANRKIFLWPENYLDPTTRDNKTPLFAELESQLLQQEISEQTVIDAYSNYLKGLEELANLRYAGAYHHYSEDDDSGEVTDVIYLFGAIGGDAPSHYWREIRNLARSQEDELVSPEFGPWRKVGTRISARHVTPIVYNGQLLVFWNDITTTAQNTVDDGKSRFIGYSHRYSLKFTSLRLDGEWTPPEAVSLMNAAPTFQETDSSVDDPLAESGELNDFVAKIFSAFRPWFGTYQDPAISLDEAYRRILTPRWGIDVHSKVREGYTLSGFMWERPYLAVDPSYGHRLLAHCAGLLVRGAVDLFDRQVILSDDSAHKSSPSVGGPIFAFRDRGTKDFSVLRRDGSSLVQITWPGCPFDYPVAASLALNADNLAVFERHWGGAAGWSTTGQPVANVRADAGLWSVFGSPGETVIETENELFLLQPSARVASQFVLHRLGTTLVRDVARKLFTDGVDGLLATAHQLGLSEPLPEVSGARTHDATVRNPIANDAPYGIYYQEIFQHIPLLIAYYLNSQGKFEHAQRWYHHVFDPTSPEPRTDPAAPETDRNWKYRQFRGQEQAKLRDVLSDTAAIQKYREDPFNAHAVARLRVSAYQKAVVMRYIDNLLDWADDRFTRFQMESVNEAMMLYVTANEILGPRPLQLGECGELSDATRTYDKLKDSISKDGEFLLEVEELIPKPTPLVPTGLGVAPLTPVFGLKGLLAFPVDDKLSVAAVGKEFVTPAGKAGKVMPVDKTAALPPRIGAVNPKTDARAGRFVSQPALTSAAPASMPTEGTDPGAMITEAMKGAHAAKESHGATGVIVADASSVAMGPVGPSAAVSTGRLTRASAGKIALALPLDEGLVKSFALRQQFRFVGGLWKNNGGRFVPPTLGDRFGRAVVRQVSAAFCIPRNETLEEYWHRVEDRIQKIRTCRDITGRKRELSLFAPPIDPSLLARARAAGISLDDALTAFDGMIPQYRFVYLLQKAKEFAGTVQSFGAALQSALERKDSEELVRLQATQQQQILALTTKAKEWELESASANLESTERRRTAVENRRAHYAGLLQAGLNEWEVAQGIATHTASIIKGGSATMAFISGALGLIPQLGSPFAMKYGGVELKELPEKVAFGLQMLSEVAGVVATSAALEAGLDRRREDWVFQQDQSQDELSQIDKQIDAAQIARDLAEHAIKLHEKSIQHNDELLEYHEGKFSGLGFYTWLASQLQRTYRDAYNMAYRMARYAEQAYRFEREDYASELFSGQYWEPARAGVLAGNRLTLDLQQLEQRYVETDVPKRELTDHVFSLRQWNPKALIELRQKGACTFQVPELFFDLASPGDYRRRLRSVRVSIPAVTGPYINVMATVSLNGSRMRYEPTLDLRDAPRPRLDSITTSSARNDAGAFELNFRGEKYVPFEGAGAVAEWSLSLPSPVRMFDYNTISDVVLHFDYTASFDALLRDVVQGITSGIVTSVQDRLASDGILRAFSLKDEFPAEHARIVAGDTAEVTITSDHLPFFLRFATVKEASLVFTDKPDGLPSVGAVEFDGALLGSPTEAEQVRGVSVPLAITGTGPWTHKIRVAAVPADARVWMMMRFAAG